MWASAGTSVVIVGVNNGVLNGRLNSIFMHFRLLGSSFFCLVHISSVTFISNPQPETLVTILLCFTVQLKTFPGTFPFSGLGTRNLLLSSIIRYFPWANPQVSCLYIHQQLINSQDSTFHLKGQINTVYFSTPDFPCWSL